MNMLAPQQISIDVLQEKYCKGKESAEDQIFRRVAKGVSGVEKTKKKQQEWEQKFYENMCRGGIGAGRIMSAAGTGIEATLNNCYVIPVGDSIIGQDKDGFPGIYIALEQAAETMRRGGGVGYDFSRIRPRNAKVKGTHSFASGPCSYMDVFDKSCETVESAGCFTGDTLIHTTDGLIPIRQIVESDKTYYAVTHAGPRKITAKFNNGVKEVWEIHTAHGHKLKVTPQHKFAQFYEGKIITVPIKDIIESENKKLLISIPETNLEQYNITSDYQQWTKEQMEAYVVGAFHGNGSWRWSDDKSKVKCISIANNVTKSDVSKKIFDILTRLGLTPFEEKRKNENTLEINAYSVDFFKQWFDKGIDKGLEMHVPTFIFESTPDVWAAYIAGIFEADGTISESKSNYRLRITTLSLIEDIQILLNALGVPNRISLERKIMRFWKAIYLIGIYGPTAQSRFNATVGKFMLNKLQSVASRDRCGFSHEWADVKYFGIKKSELSDFWPGNEHRNPNISLNALCSINASKELTNTVTTEVSGVRFLGLEQVYDLEVEEVHLLSGNGVYTSNSRRGAQMGIMKMTHPDIMEFITAKRTEGRWNNFNVSVFVSDAFMEAKDKNLPWQLVHKAEPCDELITKGAFQRDDGLWVYATVNAKELWDTIMKSNYDFAEPGILFEDNINRDNNLRYVEVIDATNPCAEQPLPPYGCCDLGPIILTKFVKNPFTPEASFDLSAFEETVKVQVRFLDNVLEATMWPLDQQKQESDSKRRIGVGYTGLGNALAMLNLPYNDQSGLDMASIITRTMRDTAYLTSVDLAKEKGAFPLFNADKYLEEGTCASRLPEAIKSEIRKHGIRNSHLLSIAPTGTVSLAFADNASNGLEPPFSLAYTRKKRQADLSWQEYKVIDHGFRVYLSTLADKEFAQALLNTVCEYKQEFVYRGQTLKVRDVLPKSIITAQELTTKEHMDMLAAIQPYNDSSLSKTVNVPADYPFDDFKLIYDRAHQLNLKGISTYRPNNIVGAVLSVGTEVKKEEKPAELVKVKETNFLNDKHIQRPKGRLKAESDEIEYIGQGGKESAYVIVSFVEEEIAVPTQNENEDAELLVISRPVEVFVEASPDSVPGEYIKAYGVSLSYLARSGLDIFCKALRKYRTIKSDLGKVRYGWYYKPDGSKVPRYHESVPACMAYAIQKMLQDAGIIDEQGYPYSTEQLLKQYQTNSVKVETQNEETQIETIPVNNIIPGKTCTECGAAAVIKKDGCSYCTSCGAVGACG